MQLFMSDRVIIDLGCGQDPEPGSVGVDVAVLEKVDLLADLDSEFLPFATNSVDEVYLKHVVEHLESVVDTIEELSRIVRPGGEIHIYTPHFTSRGNHADPTHKHSFSYRSFDYFARESETKEWISTWYTDVELEIVEREIRFNNRRQVWNKIVRPIANKYPDIYEKTPLRIFPANELYVRLKMIE